MRRIVEMLCAKQTYETNKECGSKKLNKKVWVDLDSIYGIEEVFEEKDGKTEVNKTQCVIHYGIKSGTVMLSPKQVKYMIENKKSSK